jgi:ribosomal protein L37E
VCERCGAEMYRMHAVWRCASCGYKTDCCGW